MEQQLYVVSLNESNDMGIASHSSKVKTFPLVDLKPGARLTVDEAWGQPNPADANDTIHLVWDFTVDQLTDEKMVFTFKERQFTLNRYWQVLGTGYYGIPNAYISVSKRFVFYFSAAEPTPKDSTRQLQKLYKEMGTNDSKGDYWKNIPLAKDALHLIKDSESLHANPDFKEFCETVVEDELFFETETPRLLLSFIDLYHVMAGNSYLWHQKTYRLLRMTHPEVSEDEKLKLMGETRHLKYDPVQLTEEWEENLYEVEKEMDELFKGQDRYMGFCHEYWSAKRVALAKRGIQWRSPQQMNPRTKFD